MPPSLCAVTGTLYDGTGEAVPGVYVTLIRVEKDGVVVSDVPVPFPTDEDGAVTFNVLRGARAWIHAPAEGWNVFGGLAVVIPNAASATLEALQPSEGDSTETGIYLVYTALVSQTGTAAPVATELRNTLGDVVWSRAGAGSYVATLADAFPDADKVFIIGPRTFPFGGADLSGIVYAHLEVLSANTIGLTVGGTEAPSDDTLTRYPVEIRVYP